MSTDDKILRLENAMSTLLELAAARQRRVSRLDESLVALVELSRSHNEGMDDLRTAQAESEQKIAALADAQIRAEEGMSGLREAQAESDRKIAALADAHIRTEDALARLAETVNDILRNGRNGQSPS